MQKKKIFNLEFSYVSLPDTFYSFVKPEPVTKPEMVLLNHPVCRELNISLQDPEAIMAGLLANDTDTAATSFAQAYSGHQFGYFTNLGDGRALVKGEQVTTDGKRFDIQLKGSGRTPYSRRGDGKATLKSMLREYLISEAMHYLKIPTSRSLAVIKTGEPVFRESRQEGAILARVMKSHIRVGTFEYAAQFGADGDLNALTHYTIKRLYPEIEKDENPALSLLTKVMKLQIDLIASWMRVGFIHGVMNTDNCSISAETFDYGPCSFLNYYHPHTVFSSIDSYGRYAFGNQSAIIKWNIAKFAEALLPIIHPDINRAVPLDILWKETYYETMLGKLGVEDKKPESYSLVDELLQLMKTFHLDYTNTFLALAKEIDFETSPVNRSEIKPWLHKWQKTIANNSNGFTTAQLLMKEANPVFIPRNHVVEEALGEAVEGDLTLFEKLLGVVTTPYQSRENHHSYMMPPDAAFETAYQTFCGT
jgi:serine/tyrosine/threonine adenylyltransferase